MKKNLVFFLAGAILASSLIKIYFKIGDNSQNVTMLVHNSWLNCVEDILEYKGHLNKSLAVAFPENFSDWNVLEIKPNEKYRDLTKNYSTCLYNGYVDTSLEDPLLEEKIDYYNKTYNGKIYLSHSPSSKKVRIYFETR